MRSFCHVSIPTHVEVVQIIQDGGLPKFSLVFSGVEEVGLCVVTLWLTTNRNGQFNEGK